MIVPNSNILPIDCNPVNNSWSWLLPPFIKLQIVAQHAIILQGNTEEKHLYK